MKIRDYLESFLELLYPEKNTCFICDDYDENIGDKYICQNCYSTLEKNTGNLCEICSKLLDDTSSSMCCNECKNTKRYFVSAKSPLKYSSTVKKLIYDYKYYDKAYYYKMFGNILLEYIESNNYKNYDLITSVPLHRSKLNKRGYNQSKLIAKYLSSHLNIKYVRCLKRIRKTDVQNTLSKKERKINIDGAFSIVNKHIIKQKKILIIDDIYTTGSTIDECSKILVNNGAKNIYALTIARG